MSSLKNKIQSFFAAAEKSGTEVTVHGRETGMQQLGRFAKVVIVAMTIVAGASAMKLSFDSKTSSAADFDDAMKTSFNIPSPGNFPIFGFDGLGPKFASPAEREAWDAESTKIAKMSPDELDAYEIKTLAESKILLDIASKWAPLKSGYESNLAKINRQAEDERLANEAWNTWKQSDPDLKSSNGISADDKVINQMIAAVNQIKANLDETCDLQPATVKESAKVSCEYPGVDRSQTLEANSLIFKVGEFQGLPVFVASDGGQGAGVILNSKDGDHPSEETNGIFIEKDFINEVMLLKDADMREAVIKFNLSRAVAMNDLAEQGQDPFGKDVGLADEVVAKHMFEDGFNASEIAAVVGTSYAVQTSFLTKAWNLDAENLSALKLDLKSREAHVNSVISSREVASTDMRTQNAVSEKVDATMNSTGWTVVEPDFQMNLETGVITYPSAQKSENPFKDAYFAESDPVSAEQKEATAIIDRVMKEYYEVIPVAKDSRAYSPYKIGSLDDLTLNTIRNSLQRIDMDSEDGLPVFISSNKNTDAANGFGVITNINGEGEPAQAAIFLDKGLLDAIDSQAGMQKQVLDFTIARASVLSGMTDEIEMASKGTIGYSTYSDLQVVDSMMDAGVSAKDVYETVVSAYRAETAFISESIGADVPMSGINALLEHKLELVGKRISERDTQSSRESYQVSSSGGGN